MTLLTLCASLNSSLLTPLLHFTEELGLPLFTPGGVGEVKQQVGGEGGCGMSVSYEWWREG